MDLFRIAGTILSLAALASSAMAAGPHDSQDPWKFPDFSATQLVGPPQKTISMKVHWSGTDMRVDISDAIANLYLPATGKIYKLTVYPDKKRECIVMTTEQGSKLLPSPLEFLQGKTVQRTPLGTETVEGHNCKVEKVVVTRYDGRMIESKVWEADDLEGIPVKIDSKTEHGRILALYHDVTITPQDKTQFAAPEKCIPYDKMYQVVEQKTIE